MTNIYENKPNYNQGNIISSADSPIYKPNFTGIPITPTHDPCGYWHKNYVPNAPNIIKEAGNNVFIAMDYIGWSENIRIAIYDYNLTTSHIQIIPCVYTYPRMLCIDVEKRVFYILCSRELDAQLFVLCISLDSFTILSEVSLAGISSGSHNRLFISNDKRYLYYVRQNGLIIEIATSTMTIERTANLMHVVGSRSSCDGEHLYALYPNERKFEIFNLNSFTRTVVSVPYPGLNISPWSFSISNLRDIIIISYEQNRIITLSRQSLEMIDYGIVSGSGLSSTVYFSHDITDTNTPEHHILCIMHVDLYAPRPIMALYNLNTKTIMQYVYILENAMVDICYFAPIIFKDDIVITTSSRIIRLKKDFTGITSIQKTSDFYGNEIYDKINPLQIWQ